MTDNLDELARLQRKLRMIVCHATGGHSQDIDASDNDICVRISAHRNQVYQAGKDATAREVEALRGERDRFYRIILENNPDTTIADNGMTVWDGLRNQARAALGDGK